jgi:hypothetical protein
MKTMMTTAPTMTMTTQQNKNNFLSPMCFHNMQKHFKQNFKILMQAIIAAKKLYYNNLLLNSKNKQKTAWNIIKTVTEIKKCQ